MLLAAARQILKSFSGRLLVCVSGGADSMALLHLCVSCGMDCVAAHCNFRLRGEESERDCRFVRRECTRLGVELLVKEFDTQQYARRNALSIEMACRELRYDWFRHLRSERGLERIVVAHNADDDTETMLLNLLRGTGIKGLTGMSSDNGEILRPLLGAGRSEIEMYLKSIGAEWIVDSSNLSSEYKRNFLRNEVLPALRTRWPGLDKTLARTRSHLADTALLADAALAAYLPSDPCFLPAASLEACPAPALLIHAWLWGQGATPTQISDMRSAVSGSRWQLPDAVVVKNSEGLRLIGSVEARIPRLRMERLENSAELRAEIVAQRGQEVLYCAPCEGLHLRPLREDDYIQPLGMKGRASVRKVLKDARLAAELRARYLLVADADEQPVWLPGIKRSSLFPVLPDSEYVLRVCLE